MNSDSRHMNHDEEVARYVEDPSLLVELCREVIERLDAGGDNGETATMEAQLREIARAIDKLDKQGVPVPDTLRAEKTRLAAALGVSEEPSLAGIGPAEMALMKIYLNSTNRKGDQGHD